MNEFDSLELAQWSGLPWVDLSLIRPDSLQATPTGPALRLLERLWVPVYAKRDRLTHGMPYQLAALSDEQDCERFTTRQDDDPPFDSEEQTPEDRALTQAPLVRYCRHLLLHAIHLGASDIHINPTLKGYQVFFRMDGFLVEQPEAPHQLENRLIARIKVMANLDLTESGQAQDGAVMVEDAQMRRRRFRVAILPSLFGEKAVLRLVGHASEIPTRSALGLTPTQHLRLEQFIEQTQGLILITGPTGSGKSVTLARLLLDLARQDRHVASLEDPIEFELEGVHQVQLNPKRKLDFATSLRALLRQDPDVLMIGEIRDRETASIAIQAAQTGHLVLATLHTKRAVDALPRLAHFGIHETSVNGTLRIVIAQRLVRTLCRICAGLGCADCRGGYRGRTGLFEFWAPGDPVLHETTDFLASVTHQLALKRTTLKEVHRVLGYSPIAPEAPTDLGEKKP